MSAPRKILAELIPQTTVTHVNVDLKQSCWQIYLNAEREISEIEIKKVKAYLCQKVPELKEVQLILSTKLSEKEITENISQIWQKVSQKVVEQIPSCSGWIKTAQYNYEAGKLEISLKDKLGLKFFQQKMEKKIFEQCFQWYTGCNIKLFFKCFDSENLGTSPVWQEKMEKQFVERIKENQIQGDNSGSSYSEGKPYPEGKFYNGNKSRGNKTVADPGAIIGKVIKDSPVPLNSIIEEERQAVVQGRVFKRELRELKSGRNLFTFNITDNTDSISAKIFLEKENQTINSAIKDGYYLKIRGPVQYDKFSRELTMMAYDINAVTVSERQDKAEEKRIEFHLHTKMSAMDSVLDVSKAVKTAAKWGHSAIAITDHGVVQAFPEAYNAGEKNGVKIIYGVEGYLIDDGKTVVEYPVDTKLLETEYVVFDLETTGLHPRTEEITEIGAVKMKGLEIVDRFSTMVNPGKKLSREIIKLTGITDEMLVDAPSPKEALLKFKEFIGGRVLVAHNASFDIGFIRVHMNRQLNQSIANSVVDTLTFARSLYPRLKNHKLNTLCNELKINLQNHHRAVDDAEATARLFMLFLQESIKLGHEKLIDLNQLVTEGKLDKVKPYHVTILTQTQAGLKNLYKLISLAHLNYFHRHPRMPKSLLKTYRQGLLIGSACEAGELFKAIIGGAPEEKIEKLASFYDYLEIQPLGNSQFLVANGQLKNIDQLKQIYQRIYNLGKKLGKPVIATGDVHFLNPEDEIYRRILMTGQGYDDADKQPPLYFKTTEEMLQEFEYLGEEAAYEVVIRNTNELAAKIEKILPIPKETYPPKIEGSEEQIETMSETRARELYGSPLPPIVRARLDKELHSIIGNGFAVLYLIAHKLVKKSLDDGYLVGSRGSVGSSLVAHLTDITEVNALPPHYRCPNCKHSEFIEDGSYGCGADMPDKKCPKCSAEMVKDGHDIPFEVFLGFEGDKVPDIDLNFSGDYQPRAHKFTEELFGKDNVFKAGTIGTIAEKTAYGFVKKYLDSKDVIKREAEISRLVEGCTGVKRTTGQHPGGMMVVPKDIDIHDFTPIQRPADDKSSEFITTHFDYHAISARLVKLDILGHDDPTVINMLEELTGVNARTIPLDDKKTLSLFSGTEALGVTQKDIRSQVGTYAIPEFGTKFVRQMLVDTKPTTFSELVRISGFSHGTDVWLNNAQDLIRAGICQLSEAISARDDIMLYLLYNQLPPKQAFKIMEKVRKGKGLDEADVILMNENNVPQWFIDSCRKIKYLFPKAHATAYVMMAFRIAWYKVYYPEAFYATYFTVRADDFDADLIVQGEEVIVKVMKDIEEKGIAASQKEKGLLTILEVALEMYERKISLLRVSLYQSEATRFQIINHQILPPLSSLQGVGESAACSIVEARKEYTFSSIEDLQKKAKVSKTVIEILQQHGCLDGMEETDQLSFF